MAHDFSPEVPGIVPARGEPARDWALERGRRRQREALGQQLSIARATSDLVATTDIDGFLTFLNGAAYRLLGLEPGSDIARLGLADLFAPESRRRLRREWLPGAIAQRVWHTEAMLQPSAGEALPVSLILIAHRDAEDNVSFFSAVIRDIRPLKASEQQRRQLQARLHEAQRMETVGRLASGIAHDFNNILTVIVGYAELGLENLSNQEESREELEIILNSAQKAARLSNQLLDFSCKQRAEPELLDLNGVIRDSGKLLDGLGGETMVIEMDLQQHLPHIHMDRSRVEQVILNLAVNARDAMPTGGRLLLQTRGVSLTAEQAQDMGLAGPGDYVRLRVSDTGEGIDEDVLTHIFEPFYTTKEFGKGTGLGLASVYGAVRQSHGHIGVNSGIGQGTTFDMHLPAASAQPGPDAGEAPQCQDHELLSLAAEKVLLVESDPPSRQLLHKALRSHGYQVFAVPDSARAWQAWDEQSGEIAVMVCALGTQREDALNLCTGIRRAGAASEPEILLLCAESGQALTPSELERYGARQLFKPVSVRRLLKEIRIRLDELA